MSTWRNVRVKPTAGAERKPAPLVDEAQQESRRTAEITALELEVDPEIGCDPYNSTGQHLVEALKSLQKD